jgi:hypothetical protein
MFRSSTLSGTASTERTPERAIVWLAKRGSCCASAVKTDLPFFNTSSITVRLMRTSSIVSSLPRMRATLIFIAPSFSSSRSMITQRSAGTASNTSEAT